MFICLDCKHIFSEDDIATWEESRGEYWGAPCYESVSGCPCCKGDCVETYRCSYCNEWIDGDYIRIDEDRYCEGCIVHCKLGDE